MIFSEEDLREMQNDVIKKDARKEEIRKEEKKEVNGYMTSPETSGMFKSNKLIVEDRKNPKEDTKS